MNRFRNSFDLNPTFPFPYIDIFKSGKGNDNQKIQEFREKKHEAKELNQE